MTNVNEFNSSELETESLKEPEKIFTHNERIFALIALLLGFAFVRFVLFSTAGFITTILYIAIITAAIVFLKGSGCRFTILNKFIAAVLYLFSAVFSITDNRLIKFLDIVFLFAAGAYFVYSSAAGKSRIDRYLPFSFGKAVFEYPFSGLSDEIYAVRSTGRQSKFIGTFKLILIGLLVAVLPTIIIAMLLMSADDGINKLFISIIGEFGDINFMNIFWQLLIAVPCACYLFGMLYVNVHNKECSGIDEKSCEERISGVRSISNIIMYTAVTPICVLYGMFFISQTNYFLSAFMGRLPSGYIYSDYARQGFFELFAISVINLVIIVAMNLFSKHSGRFKPRGLKIYTVILCISTIFMIAAAVSKMVMYISVYGLTRLRLYTSWFMALLLAFFVLIIIKQVKFDLHIARWGTAVFTVMFALLCFSRPDALIARYNIEMYLSGHLSELDKAAIFDMSDDAVYELVKSGLTDAETVERKRYSRNRPCEDQNISSVLVNQFLKQHGSAL